jgi:ABC-type sugar transport system ATPase subunit
MASITLDQLSKRFHGGATALHALELEVAEGELLVLVGPSGCGKSTALRLVAGLEEASGGRILIGARDVTRVPAQERNLAMVFQNYALYPHKTVRQNLAFPLQTRRVARAEIERRVREVAATLDLEQLLDRMPRQLSGGQRQRVALGRAIVREPDAFLLDEPLSNLDAALRTRMRTELHHLHRRLAATMMYVTHDQEEAMTLGTRVAVLREGKLEQVAPPMEIYTRPATAFVGSFVGSPAMNILRGEVIHGRIQCGRLGLDLPGVELPASGTHVLFGIRPRDLALVPKDEADLLLSVDVIEPLGDETIVHLAPDPALVALVSIDHRIAIGESVGIRVRRDRVHLWDAHLGTRLGTGSC